MTAFSYDALRRPTPGARARRLGIWGWTALILAGAFAMPAVAVVLYALQPSGDVWAHLTSTVLFGYVANSLLLMLGVGAGSFVVGAGTAWLVTMCRFPGRRVFEWALLLPLAIPAYIVAYAYAGALDYAGPVQTGLRALFGWSGAGDYWFPQIRSLGGAIAVMTLTLYPYVYLLARSAFLDQSVCMLEVGRTLGRGPWTTFRSVALPLARPALAVGVALAMMESLADFGTVQHFGIGTFTTGIYRVWLGMGDAPAAAQLASLLMLFVAALVVAEHRSRGGQRYHNSTGRRRSLPSWRLKGALAWIVAGLVATPVLLGFVVPAGMLLTWAFETGGAAFGGRFLEEASNSFLLAGTVAMLAVAGGLLLAYGVRRDGGPVTRGAARAAGLGYAIPGPVIALGVMLPFAAFDRVVDDFARDHLGFSTGLILSGTIAAVAFACLVRFFALSHGTVEAALAKVTPSIDGAARSLGHGPGAVLRRIHAPMVRGGMMTAALLVFVDVMKELPATLMLRPFNFDTLAVRAYQLAADEQLRLAAGPALAIVAVGLIPVALLSRAISNTRSADED